MRLSLIATAALCTLCARAVLPSPGRAAPPSGTELRLQTGYEDGHTFRYLERHVDARISFTVVDGSARKRKDRESLTSRLLTGSIVAWLAATYAYRIRKTSTFGIRLLSR